MCLLMLLLFTRYSFVSSKIYFVDATSDEKLRSIFGDLIFRWKK